MAEALDVIRASALQGIPHGFLGRRGGVSAGPAAGLNCGLGSGDTPEAVAENRRRSVAAVLPDARVVGVYQAHSPLCVTMTEPWPDSARPEADALVTRSRRILLAIVTADCAPVLLADREAGVIGAAHAGWKGALAGVIANTVDAMVALGARREAISAALGPCIAQSSYEVDDGFRTRFTGLDNANRCFFASGAAGRWQFDLEAFTAARLQDAGIGKVEPLGLDTYANAGRFFSFRRATHLGELAYGRQISLIGLA